MNVPKCSYVLGFLLRERRLKWLLDAIWESVVVPLGKSSVGDLEHMYDGFLGLACKGRVIN